MHMFRHAFEMCAVSQYLCSGVLRHVELLLQLMAALTVNKLICQHMCHAEGCV